MPEIKNWTELNFNTFMESLTSPLSEFKDLQLYQTLSLDDNGEVITDQVSEGLVTLNTSKLSEAEKQELIGTLQASKLGSGDVSGILNLVYGHIQSANFVTGANGAGWRIDGDGNLEATSGTFRGNVTGATITGGTIRTSASGKRVELDSTDNRVLFYDDTSLVGYIDGDGGGIIINPTEDEAGIALMYTTAGSSNLTGLTIDEAGVQVGTGLDMITNDILPPSDNTKTCGKAGLRWSDVRSVLINGADYCFENDWTLTENYMMKIKQKGIAVLDELNNLVAFIGEEGFYAKDFKNINQLSYTKTTRKQRIKMSGKKQ